MIAMTTETAIATEIAGSVLWPSRPGAGSRDPRNNFRHRSPNAPHSLHGTAWSLPGQFQQVAWPAGRLRDSEDLTVGPLCEVQSNIGSLTELGEGGRGIVDEPVHLGIPASGQRFVIRDGEVTELDKCGMVPLHIEPQDVDVKAFRCLYVRHVFDDESKCRG